MSDYIEKYAQELIRRNDVDVQELTKQAFKAGAKRFFKNLRSEAGQAVMAGVPAATGAAFGGQFGGAGALTGALVGGAPGLINYGTRAARGAANVVRRMAGRPIRRRAGFGRDMTGNRFLARQG